MVQGLLPLTTLLLVPLSNLKLGAYKCLQQNYYGIYGGRHAFIVDDACWTSSFSLMGLGTSATHDRQESRHLVWLERVRVDPSLLDAPFDVELDWVLGNLTDFSSHSRTSPWSSGIARAPQLPLSTSQRPARSTERAVQTLHRAHDGVLLSMGASVLDAVNFGEVSLPRFWRYSVFPEAPIPLYPVPEEAKQRLREALSTIKFNHVVASIVNGISVYSLRRDIRYLTGEDALSNIVSRHSFSEGVLRAAEWLKEQIEETGASCVLEAFQVGFAPNVICTYAASTNTMETIIVGAHYDSRGSFGSVRAPGANDDGSGTGALVGIARAIARRGVVFRKNVQLVAFAGEEQGMVGSRVYARTLKDAGANVTMMIQGDMLAYHVSGELPQLALSDPALVGTAEVTQILANVSAIYSPDLKVGYSPYPGGSDHQRFHEYGFPAAQVEERIGLIADPMYHDSGDLSEREGYDFEQIQSIAKVELAAVLHVAGFDLSGPAEDVEGGDDS
ncbi:Zn-dependent exopeptidase [Dichomitus squalens]|uniref:Peptide hydrolase n=1 Tax=Dichomitus squalens TaxID=114155 RepID=A0A4Q9M8E4_9APHY|nr:Zn-dependent exopeptidase [Dichomitus squalens]